MRLVLDFYKKMAAKFGFWEIRERDILKGSKKYTFGKVNFKTFFKTRIFEILPPFLSTLHTWMDPGMDVFVSADGGPKKFFYARTLRVLAPCILQIKPLVYWFVVECMIVCCVWSLKMFYKKIYWEKIHENCFVVVGPWSRAVGPWNGRAFGPCSRAFGPWNGRAFGPLTVGPSALRGAKHRGKYLRHGLQINTYQLVL